MKILYIHQEPSESVLKRLNKWGDVTCTQDADKGIFMLYKRIPTLIVVHENSIGYDIERFLEKCKFSVPNANIKFILLSDIENKHVGNKEVANSLYDIFVTPFNLDDFEVRVKTIALHNKTLEKYRQKHQNIGEEYVSRETYLIVKRALDILLSSVALVLLSPLLLLVAALIKIDSKGPVFYLSKRVGNGYDIFSLYKFRTMRTDADQLLDKMKTENMYSEQSTDNVAVPETTKGTILVGDGNQLISEADYLIEKKSESSNFIKIKNDPRITKLGRFLRNTSIDELPQLINILKGDMSIVGNRPLPLYEAETLTADNWSNRFIAPAGLTGLWQVSKRGKAEMSIEERIALDNEYAERNSLWLDLKIMFKTIPALLQTEDV